MESTELSITAVRRVVVIDHHRMMVNHIENAVIFYHEPYASSASEMVAELVQYMGSLLHSTGWRPRRCSPALCWTPKASF